ASVVNTQRVCPLVVDAVPDEADATHDLGAVADPLAPFPAEQLALRLPLSPNPIVQGNRPIERLECGYEGRLRIALLCCLIEACSGVGVSDEHRLEARDV